MRTISVLVYEKLALMRHYICTSLHSSEIMSVLRDTGDLSEIVTLMCTFVPDVLLLSLDHDFSETSAIAAIHAASPRTDIIVLAPNIPNMQISDMIRAYSLSYVNKTSAEPADVIAAIVAVGQHHTYLDETLGRELVAFYREGTLPLTKKELLVLDQLTKGHSNSTIAENLGVTVETVKTHASKIYLKLNVSGRAEAIVYALDNKLVAQLAKPRQPRRRQQR